MDRFRMTDNKLLWHLDRFKDWSEGNRIVPIHIELGITNACNLACKYCYGDMIGKTTSSGDRVDMPRDVIFELLDDAKKIGVRSISLVGEGENTVSPYFYATIEKARSVGIDFGVATNGIAFKDDKILDVLESFVWIRFSIGGSNKESYIAVHGKDRFDKVINVIKKCVAVKKANKLNTTIGTQMVVIRNNVDDIVPLAKLSGELGVDYFVAKPCSDTPDGKLDVGHDEYLKMGDLFDRAERFSRDNYSVVMKRDKFFNRGVNNFSHCYGTHFIIGIDAKGNVAPCGHLHGYEADKFRMGNIYEKSFGEIVYSDRYWEVQDMVTKLDVNNDCETNCLHHAMNIFLDDFTHPPEHINFV